MIKNSPELSQCIVDAQTRMHGSQQPAVVTPLTHSHALSKLLQANVYFKEENRQHTGSFKYRGALNKILSLDEQQLTSGVVTASSGNHGMACAFAAAQQGVDCKVYVPASASPLKVERIAALGASVEAVDGDCLAAELAAQACAQSQQRTYLSPYNDIDVIAGQGTCGLEIVEQLPNVDRCYMSVGGGGLISGIGSALQAHNENCQVVGCWPINSPVMYECMKANQVIEVPEQDTLSDGTAGNVEQNTCTLALCQQLIKHSELVSEQSIASALTFMLEQEQLLVEGAAALAVAAALQNKDACKGKNVVIVLCGKNIALAKLQQILQ